MWTFRSSQSVSSELQKRVNDSIDALFARKDLGYLNPRACMDSVNDCKSHQSFFQDKKKLVVVGLGGSSLGTKALCEALAPYSWQDKIQFLDNVDAHSVDHFLSTIEKPEEWGWILCSKSGGTIEVTSLYDYCFEWIQKKHQFSIVKQTACITEEKANPLFNFSKANNCLTLNMPENIGGRFSAFTNIGLFPLSFLGVNLDDLVKGYTAALEDRESLGKLVCHLWAGFERRDVSLYSFQYSDRLVQWGLWLQQLWSESLSKKTNRKGEQAPILPTIVSCRGASDQHSVLQQLIEGHEKKSACFHLVQSSAGGEIKIKNSHFEKTMMKGRTLGELLKVEAEATVQAVSEAGSPTIVLEVSDLNESSMTQLMGLWMLSIGVLGELADINAFDQPGVESGKVIARRVLSQP